MKKIERSIETIYLSILLFDPVKECVDNEKHHDNENNKRKKRRFHGYFFWFFFGRVMTHPLIVSDKICHNRGNQCKRNKN